MEITIKSFDVIIVGGAMTGATLALALDKWNARSHASKRLSIAVVEAYGEKSTVSNNSYDSRSVALSLATIQSLDSLSLWQDIEPLATAIRNIHISDRNHLAMTEFDAEQMALPALGYVIELADLSRLNYQKMQDAASITLFCPKRVQLIERQLERVIVTLESGEQLHAKLLVAADGTHSLSCQTLHLPQQQHDFDQVAVIANVVTEQAHQYRAFERFTEFGPIALLPMKGEQLSLVWCMSAMQAHSILSISDDDFLQQLQTNFGWRLGRFMRASARVNYPLSLRYRTPFISHRVVAIGNAAQTLHPVTGQGLNLGIRDVMTLIEILTTEETMDIGEYQCLFHYQQRRKDDKDITMTATSQLAHLFTNRWLPTTIGRNLGLIAMDNCSAIRRPLLNRALGFVKR